MENKTIVNFIEGERYSTESMEGMVIRQFLSGDQEDKYFKEMILDLIKCIKSCTVEVTTKIIEDEES